MGWHFVFWVRISTPYCNQTITVNWFLKFFLQLCQMLTLDPDKRIAVAEALNHPYLDEGRLRYHSCMCACCHTSASGMRQYSREFEPSAERPFDDEWERELTCVSKVKDKMHRFILDQINSNRVPLCINPSSAAYKSFASSTVAHPSELPPSPHHWEWTETKTEKKFHSEQSICVFFPLC